MKSVELLAPAKDLQSAVAAVDYGADAVYIGGAKFGARYAAGNSAGEIARVVEYAHRYGVRVHATLNTLIYDDELEAAERQARELIAAGVDALIVQDMALRRMNLPARVACFDADVQYDTCPGAFPGRVRVRPGDPRTGAFARRNTGHLRCDRGRGGMFRPRGDLCRLQRPLFPLAVGVRPQRATAGRAASRAA